MRLSLGFGLELVGCLAGRWGCTSLAAAAGAVVVVVVDGGSGRVSPSAVAPAGWATMCPCARELVDCLGWFYSLSDFMLLPAAVV